MSYYLGKAIPKFYHDRIKQSESVESDVENFWNNTLPHYFTQDHSYGIEQEQRPLEGIVKQRADITIRYVKSGDPKKVILMGNKRRGYETQTSKWRVAVEQLTGYLKLIRAEQGLCALCGAVAIGTRVRFYKFDANDVTMQDLQDGKAYQVQEDEREIHGVLVDLVKRKSH